MRKEIFSALFLMNSKNSRNEFIYLSIRRKDRRLSNYIVERNLLLQINYDVLFPTKQ